MSHTFDEYFTNITKGLNLRESSGNIDLKIEERCKKITENFGNVNFSFETVSRKHVLNLIKKLPGNKATVLNDISVSVLKESMSAYYEKLTDIFNNYIQKVILSKKCLKKLFLKSWYHVKNRLSASTYWNQIFQKCLSFQIFFKSLTNHSTQQHYLKWLRRGK